MNSILTIISFGIIGASLKYIDNAFDEDRANKKTAAAITPIVLLIWIYLSISDPSSATILSSVLFAVLLTGKIDNPIFLLSAIVIIALTITTINIL